MEVSLSLQNVQARWPDLITSVRSRDYQLQALLRSGWPLAVSGNTIFIQFKYEYHAKRVSEDPNPKLLEEILKQLLGQQVQIHCLVPGESPPEPRASVVTLEQGKVDRDLQAQQDLISTIEAKIAQLRGEQEQLEANIAKMKNVATKAQTVLEDLAQRIDAHRHEVEELVSEQSQLMEQCNNLKSAERTLKGESDLLNQAIIRLREQKSVEVKGLKGLQAEIATLSADKGKLAAEVSRLQQEKNQLESQKSDRAKPIRSRPAVDIPPFEGLSSIIGLDK